jgi:hypothetical protein
VLDNEMVVPLLNCTQMFQEWTDVFRPEYKAIHILWRQAHADDLAVVRIHHFAVARTQSPDEPLPIEGGDVGFVTGRNDHFFTAIK